MLGSTRLCWFSGKPVKDSEVSGEKAFQESSFGPARQPRGREGWFTPARVFGALSESVAKPPFPTLRLRALSGSLAWFGLFDYLLTQLCPQLNVSIIKILI